MKCWIIFITVLLGCGGKHETSSRVIHQLVFQLEYSPCVIIGGVGIEGKGNIAAESYKKLLQIAPDSVWVRLSYSEKPVARMYAFEALFSKNSPHLESVKTRLKEDSATVCWIAGDVEITLPIDSLISAMKR